MMNFNILSQHPTFCNTLLNQSQHNAPTGSFYLQKAKITIYMNGRAIWILAVIAIWVFLLPASSATVTMQPAGITSNYTKNQTVYGNITFSYDEYIGDTVLAISMDGTDYAAISLLQYAGNTSSYTYLPVNFAYNASIRGTSAWKRYPAEDFFFSIRADSTCGGIPCSTQTAELQGSTAKNNGLKFIINGENQIGSIPNEDAGSQRAWTVAPNANNPASVRITIRSECGRGNYSSIVDMDGDGWYTRNLINPVLIGAKAVFFISPFDHFSVSTNRTLFGGNGGIFQDGQLLTSGVEWNGTTGNINITTGYDSRSTYSITFLTPNGPKVCAYTNTSISEQSQEWYAFLTLTGETNYAQPYNETIPPELFNTVVPPCPAGTYECSTDSSSWVWNAYKINDTQNAISFSFNPATKRVVAVTSQKQLERQQTRSISIASANITTNISGLHRLSFILKRNGTEVARLSNISFNTCEDADGDGFCTEKGDCNDNNPSIYPGADELCNDVDDNCNGNIDENFMVLGWRKGDVCGLGICTGALACSHDRRNLTCSSAIKPGDVNEICNNGLDDNCNGEIDEEDIIIDGIPAKCICNSGSKKPCGVNKGACRQGYSLCIAGKWSNCINSVEPKTEVCNGADDDCDGITDNVGGANSREAAKCGCYGGSTPMQEQCNGIDDDCDGYIDNGVACCNSGEKRSCGPDVGICKPGISTCIDGGWGPCAGMVTAIPEEICYNGLDDNCNSETDEGCVPQNTCKNGIKDLNEDGRDCGGDCENRCTQPEPFIIASIFVIIAIVLIAILQMKGLLLKTEKRQKTLREEIGEE